MGGKGRLETCLQKDYAAGDSIFCDSGGGIICGLGRAGLARS